LIKIKVLSIFSPYDRIAEPLMIAETAPRLQAMRQAMALVYNYPGAIRRVEEAMTDRLSEEDFHRRAERALGELEDSFARLADSRDMDVEMEGGVLTITFEEGEPGKFIISRNSSVRQLWVSARVASYKFDWSDEAGGFVLAGTGEPLKQVLARLAGEQLGESGLAL
jgi:iron donor protein CyaY